MFIIDKLQDSIEFEKLKAGDVFIYKGHCFLKLNDEGEAFNFTYNRVECLLYETLVIPRKAEMILN